MLPYGTASGLRLHSPSVGTVGVSPLLGSVCKTSFMPTSDAAVLLLVVEICEGSQHFSSTRGAVPLSEYSERCRAAPLASFSCNTPDLVASKAKGLGAARSAEV